MNIRRIFRSLSVSIAGGVIFWTPSVFMHSVAAKDFSGLHAIALSCLIPSLTMTGFVSVWWLYRKMAHAASVALTMLIGIWLLGPLMMLIGASFSGGGFSKAGMWEVVAMTALFPVFTFMMSTYDGTLLALLLVSGCLAMIASSKVVEIVFEKRC
jgi:hypothetical protein